MRPTTGILLTLGALFSIKFDSASSEAQCLIPAPSKAKTYSIGRWSKDGDTWTWHEINVEGSPDGSIPYDCMKKECSAALDPDCYKPGWGFAGNPERKRKCGNRCDEGMAKSRMIECKDECRKDIDHYCTSWCDKLFPESESKNKIQKQKKEVCLEIARRVCPIKDYKRCDGTWKEQCKMVELDPCLATCKKLNVLGKAICTGNCRKKMICDQFTGGPRAATRN